VFVLQLEQVSGVQCTVVQLAVVTSINDETVYHTRYGNIHNKECLHISKLLSYLGATVQ
jgi:hypothetical protein